MRNNQKNKGVSIYLPSFQYGKKTIDYALEIKPEMRDVTISVEWLVFICGFYFAIWSKGLKFGFSPCIFIKISHRIFLYVNYFPKRIFHLQLKRLQPLYFI